MAQGRQRDCPGKALVGDAEGEIGAISPLGIGEIIEACLLVRDERCQAGGDLPALRSPGTVFHGQPLQ